MKRNYVLVALACVMLQAKAQEDSVLVLSDVVVEAERLQLPFSKMSRSVSVLTGDEIKKLPVQSLAEALSHISGVDIRQRGAMGGQADVGIRGSNFHQVLVMLDGVKIIDPQTGHHLLNLPLNTEYIERIEVLKGSGARIYGANAYAGVINIVTRKVEGKTAVAKVFGGDFGLIGASADATFNNQLVSVSASSSSGYRPGNDFTSYGAMYKANKKITPTTEVNFTGSLNRRQLGAAGYYVANSTEYEEVSTALAAARLVYRKNRLGITGTLSWRYNDDHYVFMRLKPEAFQNRHHTHVMMADAQGTYQTKAGITGFGFDIRRDEIYSSNLGNRQRNFYNLFLEHRFSLGPVAFNPGINVNYIDSYNWQVFPGMDVSYTFLKNFVVFANAHRSYRVPTYTDLYYKGPSNVGNPNLQPEQAWNQEAGIKYFKGRWYGYAGVFRRESKNLIDWVRTDNTQPFQPINFHEVTFEGVEAEASWKNTGILQLVSLQYTGMNASYRLPAGYFSRYSLNYLKHQVQARAGVSISKRVYVTAAYRYLERLNLAAYHLLDAKIEYRRPKWEVFAEVNNITNTAYTEAGFVPMPGRWARGGVKVLLGFAK